MLALKLIHVTLRNNIIEAGSVKSFPAKTVVVVKVRRKHLFFNSEKKKEKGKEVGLFWSWTLVYCTQLGKATRTYSRTVQ